MKSDIAITRDLLDYEYWRTDYDEGQTHHEGEITLRQKKLAEEAAKIWSFE